MDREAKLRSAKEKLKEYQKKRQKGGPNDESSSEPRISPLVTSKTPERDAFEIPVFKMFGDDSNITGCNGLFPVSSERGQQNIQENFSHNTTTDDNFNRQKQSVNQDILAANFSAQPFSQEGIVTPTSHYFNLKDEDLIAPNNFSTFQEVNPEQQDQENSLSSFTKSSSLSINSDCSARTIPEFQNCDSHHLEQPPSFEAFESDNPNGPPQRSHEEGPFELKESNECVSTNNSELKMLQSEIDDLKKSKEEVERELLQKASSLKQYDIYCQSLALELTTIQTILEKERKEARSYLENETGSLRSQLQSHADSIKIIVAEKAEYETMIKKMSIELANKSAELEKFQESLGEHVQTKKIEEENLVKLNKELEEKVLKNNRELEASTQSIDDLSQEVSELRSKVSARDLTNEKLSAELKLVTSKLEMAELNLSQLRSASDIDDVRREEVARLAEKEAELIKLTNENVEYIRRVAELTAYIQQASIDREQIIHQYTSYSQQLTTQIELLTQQLNERAKENHLLASREKDLVCHVEQLETQLQKLIQSEKVSSKLKYDLAEFQALKERLTQMESKSTDLTLERDLLQDTVKKQKEEIVRLTETLDESSTDFKTELEMLRSQKSSDVNQEDLVAACQSDKVAASRAMMQNKQLKQQLEELQEGIVQVNNSKADLLSELDMLRTYKSRAEKEERTFKMEISGLQTAIVDRDRTIEHLRDQTKYYIAFAENSINGNLDSGPRDPSGNKEQVKKLITELQAAKDEISALTSRNSELQEFAERVRNQELKAKEFVVNQYSEKAFSSPPLSDSSVSSGLNSTRPNSEILDTSTSSNDTIPSVDSVDSTKNDPHESSPLKKVKSGNTMVPTITHDVALLKLEQKFKQAMSRIAELSSEKDHLEHLVIQLQEETETVGEYITIYQYQRQQQRKRLEENERQLLSVSNDREDLKRKLNQLQNLVTGFVKDGNPNPTVVLNGDGIINQEQTKEKSNSDCMENTLQASAEAQKTKIKSANVDFTEPLVPVVIENETPNVTPTHKPSSPSKAEKILALISEIGANQILNDMEDFQPWFWEPSPGKLINI